MIQYVVNKSLENQQKIRIVYDNKGDITIRTILVKKIDHNKVIAYCDLRKSQRTFLLDNMLAAEFLQKEKP